MNEKARFGGRKQLGSVILSRVLWENYTLVKDFCLTICPHSVAPNNNKYLLCSIKPEFHECHGHVGGLSQVTVTMSRGNKSVNWDLVIIPRLSFPKATHSHGWRVLAGYRQETPPPTDSTPTPWACLMMAWILVIQYPGYLRVWRPRERARQIKPFFMCLSTRHHKTITSPSTHQVHSTFWEKGIMIYYFRKGVSEVMDIFLTFLH